MERVSEHEPARSRWRDRIDDITRPSPAIREREDHRKARLLIILSFSLAVILSISTVMSAITTTFFPDPSVSLGWDGTAVIGLAAGGFWHAFVRSRRPRYRDGAWLTIFDIYLFLVAFCLLYTDAAQSLLVALAMPILVATIFLDARGTVRLVGLSVVLGVLAVLVPELTLIEWVYSFAILVVVMALTVIVALLRESDLQQLRRLREAEREDAERLRSEVGLARTVQLAMLPRELPTPDGLQLAAYCEPAREASGDFYDVFAVEHGGDDRESLVVVVCDVAGKGMASALVMSAARAAVRTEAERDPSPARVLQRVNHLLAGSIPPHLFVTLFVGVLDLQSRSLRFASGGHPHPYHWRQDTADVVELESHGLPLGLLDGADYAEVSVALGIGDFVLVYTDGLVEALNRRHEMYGFDNARRDVEQCIAAAHTAQDRVSFVVDAMQRFVADEPKHDDVTIVALSLPDVAAVPTASVAVGGGRQLG